MSNMKRQIHRLKTVPILAFYSLFHNPPDLTWYFNIKNSCDGFLVENLLKLYSYTSKYRVIRMSFVEPWAAVIFSIVVARGYNNTAKNLLIFILSWLGLQMTVWQLFDDCLTIVWWPSDDCLMTFWWQTFVTRITFSKSL